MAFGISRIFRSTDSGAPVLQNTVGSLNNVLKAVLVNGYGAVESLGWTLEFEDVPANVCAFRMKGGTKAFVRVNDSFGTYATVESFTGMVNAHSGFERTPLTITTVHYIVKSSDAGSVPWIIIGDDAGFYMLTRPGAASYPGAVGSLWYIPQYVGDYIPLNIKNKWNFVLSCSISSGLSSTTDLPLIYSGVAVQTTRNLLLTRVSCNATSKSLLGSSVLSNNYKTYSTVLSTPNMGAFLEYPLYLHDTTNLGMLGAFPGITEVMRAPDSVAFTYSPNTVPYWEVTDANGVINIGVTLSCLANSANPSTTGFAIFRVGEGFRDVR